MMHTTAPAPVASLLAIVAMLLEVGATLQTSVDTYRGAHEMWFVGPDGMAGAHGIIRISARTGLVTGAQIFPDGEGRQVQEPRGVAQVQEAVQAVCKRADRDLAARMMALFAETYGGAPYAA